MLIPRVATFSAHSAAGKDRIHEFVMSPRCSRWWKVCRKLGQMSCAEMSTAPLYNSLSRTEAIVAVGRTCVPHLQGREFKGLHMCVSRSSIKLKVRSFTSTRKRNMIHRHSVCVACFHHRRDFASDRTDLSGEGKASRRWDPSRLSKPQWED